METKYKKALMTYVKKKYDSTTIIDEDLIEEFDEWIRKKDKEREYG